MSIDKGTVLCADEVTHDIYIESSIELLNNASQPRCSIYDANENWEAHSDIIISNYNAQLHATGIITDKNTRKHNSTGINKGGPTFNRSHSVSGEILERNVENVSVQSRFNDSIKLRHE
jgi:hypothetical protein